uniref:Uncharacterized protein n=1 Tax=Heterorhabditis bacteriophora TaxID=37862 RepID=A0A1I7WAU5_HETBA
MLMWMFQFLLVYIVSTERLVVGNFLFLSFFI